MSEDNNKWSNIAIGGFIILSIAILIILILPLSNLAVEKDEIAIVSVDGDINYNPNNTTKLKTTPQDIETALNDANTNPNVKAIVLEVNSKGGSLVASEEINDVIKSSKKPVITYIKDKGLSEGYLIASSSDYIVASPSSLIGGFGLSFTNSKKYSKTKVTAQFNEDYLNINKTNKTNMSDNSELASSQVMINQDYTRFIKLISENRNLSTNYTLELAYGKIYNGNEAENVGLIDEVGNRQKAIKIAAKEGNTTNYTLINYPKTNKTLTERLDEILNLPQFPKISKLYNKTEN